MARQSETAAGLSLRTKDATDGGGTEGALATIAEIAFVDDFNYGGTRTEKQAALRIEFHIDGFDKPWEQNYSVGPAERYEVLADGDSIKALGKNKGLNKKSNAFRLFESIEAAAEAAKIDLDDLIPLEDGAFSIRPLEGRQVRLTNVDYETVGGDAKKLLVIGEFVESDEAPAKGKATGKASSGNKLEAKVEAAIEALIDEHTSIKEGDLAKRVFDAHRKDPDAKAMMQLAMKKAWYADDSRPWTVAKGVLRTA